jgi:hypothetical protein
MAAAAKKETAKRATGKGRTSTRQTTGGNRRAASVRKHNDVLIGGRNGLAIVQHKQEDDKK